MRHPQLESLFVFDFPSFPSYFRFLMGAFVSFNACIFQRDEASFLRDNSRELCTQAASDWAGTQSAVQLTGADISRLSSPSGVFQTTHAAGAP
jgi:hypothetical protein